MVAMINLDMIGRGKLLDHKQFAFAKRLIGIPDGPAMGVPGPARSPVLGAVARAVFAHEELPLFAPEDFEADRGLHHATSAIYRTILAIDALVQRPEFVPPPK